MSTSSIITSTSQNPEDFNNNYNNISDSDRTAAGITSLIILGFCIISLIIFIVLLIRGRKPKMINEPIPNTIELEESPPNITELEEPIQNITPISNIKKPNIIYEQLPPNIITKPTVRERKGFHGVYSPDPGNIRASLEPPEIKPPPENRLYIEHLSPENNKLSNVPYIETKNIKSKPTELNERQQQNQNTRFKELTNEYKKYPLPKTVESLLRKT
jgi:hypothetical protein